ncbi:hypothetical protein DZG02_06385, partial [Clavibacter lycopersici]
MQLGVRILLAVVFVGMGVNHFVPKAARAMAAIIPPSFRRPGAHDLVPRLVRELVDGRVGLAHDPA